MEKQEVIVIGTNEEAEVFRYQNRDKYQVVLWLDRNPRRRVFLGRVSVLAYQTFDFLHNDRLIIIATSFDEYVQISYDLSQKGLVEFKDYIYYEAVNKDMAMFWGNCHIENLLAKLNSVPQFNQKYWIYRLPAISDNVRNYIPDTVFANCKLFVYQSVSEKTNGLYYSSNYMLSRLSDDATKIRVPNVFRKGFGFFPQSKKKEIIDTRDTEMKFVVYTDCHDKIIAEKYKAGVPIADITDALINEQVFSSDEIRSNFDKYLQIIQDEDAECDIKVYEYILNNYRKKCLFIDPGHIADCVYDEYIRQFFDLIGITSYDTTDVQPTGSSLLFPIYGCVREELGLDWYDMNSVIRKNIFSLTGQNGLTIPEYVEQYITICLIK